MLITRTNFYMSVAAFRHRRRRVRGVYTSPLDYDYEQKNSIQVDDTKSYEEYYDTINNYYKTDNQYDEEIVPTSKELEKSITYKPLVDPQSKKAAARQVVKKIKEKQKVKAQTPIITEQGQEGRTRTVQYRDKEGKIYYRRGGTPAWRHNNPGNLSFSSLEVAKKHGAIDVVLDRNKYGKIVHRWGVFPTQEAGEKAMRNILKERRFSYDAETGQKRTIAEAIGKIYAPAADNNNVSAYANFVQKHSGIDVYRRSIDDLDRPEFDRLIEAIKARESSVEGDIIYPKEEQKNSSI